MLRVGLTGGIACGKSRVLARLAGHGIAALDLDAVAHDVIAPGRPAHAEIVRRFGPRIVARDGSIDREALGRIVFADAEARLHLNAIVHPRVREEEARLAAGEERRGTPVLVTDAALLVESGGHLRFDRLVVVYCAPETQLRRLMERDDIDESVARGRIEAQMPLVEKRSFAHFLVETSGLFPDTDAAADSLVAELQALVAAPPVPVAVDLERALGLLLRGPSEGPCGLSPRLLLRAIVETRGQLELERVRELFVPATEGPWYRAAPDAPTGPGPETLAAPLALWALTRRGRDPAFLAAAAYSLAVLTHTDASRRAAACLYALAIQELCASGRAPDNMSYSERLAERWCGARVSEPQRMALAEALVVMAVPASAGDPDPELVDAIERLIGGRRCG
jgi:dephospho-CoA kinase